MYQIKNKIYSDAGKILKYKNKYAYNFRDVDLQDISEIDVYLNDMILKNNIAIYSGGLIRESIANDYGTLKSKIIARQFTNDDQIAIILNKDDSEEDLMLFNKMQEWRRWAGVLAKHILSLK